MKSININFITAFSISIICGCNCATKHKITLEDKLDTESVTRNVSDTLIEPERFENFYSEFKTDTLLQKERVIYPLRGKRTEYIDSINDYCCSGEYYWTENDSLDLGGEIDTTIYKVELKYLTPKMVEEVIYIPNSGFMTKIIYIRKENGKWYIDYFLSQEN